MKRLDTKTLPAFLETSRTAVLLIGSNDGDATLDHAEHFAMLWAQAVIAGLASVRFGYIDGDANPEIRERFDLVKLPSTLLFRNGAIARRARCPSTLSLHALISMDAGLMAKRPAAVRQRTSTAGMLEAA
jgi:hypothetical protein